MYKCTRLLDTTSLNRVGTRRGLQKYDFCLFNVFDRKLAQTSTQFGFRTEIRNLSSRSVVHI